LSLSTIQRCRQCRGALDVSFLCALGAASIEVIASWALLFAAAAKSRRLENRRLK
jgi:hypothetical protein